MRYFRALSFRGAGVHSAVDTVLLHSRLNDALSISGGLQQGGVENLEQDTEEMEDVVRDIAAALLGREVEFGEELEYPGPTDRSDKRKELFERLSSGKPGAVTRVLLDEVCYGGDPDAIVEVRPDGS